MTETVYLDLDDLLVAAERFLGHPADVRDYGLLEAALARPRATVFGEEAYPSLHHKAAALLLSLVGNHALIDGNKRLGLVAVLLFYGLNGHRATVTEDERVELIIAVADGRLREVDEVAKLLAAAVIPR